MLLAAKSSRAVPRGEVRRTRGGRVTVMSELRVGACSWKYPSWQGLVYSAPQGIDYLREYANRYDTVEVDQWFWSLFGAGTIRLPDPRDVRAYRQAVGDDFRFSVKAPDSITLTHLRNRDKAAALQPNERFLSPSLTIAFLDAISPLAGVLGPVMFQFEYLNRQKMPSQAQFQLVFQAFLNTLPAGHTYGLEIRNPNYLNRELFGFMAQNRVAPVLLQGYYMPSIMLLYERFRDLVAGQETVIIRLHGPDRQGMEERAGGRWDQIVAPKDDELAGVAAIARDLLSAGVRVYVNVNNHYEGSAPLTIARLRRLL
jgi:uncharacterized protein YecE (DUF72 family)